MFFKSLALWYSLTLPLSFGELVSAIQNLQNENWVIREEAVFAIGQISSPEAVYQLTPLVYDPVWTVRVAALRVLGDINSSAARDVILQRWRDSFFLDRETLSALQSATLKKIDDPVVTKFFRYSPTLLAHSQDPKNQDTLIQWATNWMLPGDASDYVIRTLGKMRNSKVVPLFTAILREPRKYDPYHNYPALDFYVAEELGKINDANATQALLEAAKRLKESENRTSIKTLIAVAYSLGNREDPQTTQMLETLLAHPDPQVRLAAAKGLKKSKDGERIYTVLIDLLRHSIPHQCKECHGPKDAIIDSALVIDALGELQWPEATDKLLQLLQDPTSSDSLKNVIIYALGKRKDPKALPGLIKEFEKNMSQRNGKHEDWHQRVAVYVALGEIKDARAVPVLREAIRDELPVATRIAAASALLVVNGSDENDQYLALEELTFEALYQPNDFKDRVRPFMNAVLQLERDGHLSSKVLIKLLPRIKSFYPRSINGIPNGEEGAFLERLISQLEKIKIEMRKKSKPLLAKFLGKENFKPQSGRMSVLALVDRGSLAHADDQKGALTVIKRSGELSHPCEPILESIKK